MSRILVVEDESHIAEGLRFNLEAEGHHVELTAEGEEALKRILQKREPFDLLVLDVMLPGKDGFAVARELRRAPQYNPLPLLAARRPPPNLFKGFEARAQYYFPKTLHLYVPLARTCSPLP